MDLVGIDIEGEIGDVDRCVLALARFRCGFGFLCDEAAAYFLQEAHTISLDAMSSLKYTDSVLTSSPFT